MIHGPLYLWVSGMELTFFIWMLFHFHNWKNTICSWLVQRNRSFRVWWMTSDLRVNVDQRQLKCVLIYAQHSSLWFWPIKYETDWALPKMWYSFLNHNTVLKISQDHPRCNTDVRNDNYMMQLVIFCDKLHLKRLYIRLYRKQGINWLTIGPEHWTIHAV